jgi:uncharacterized damage-inducible protein DinB
MTHELIAEYEKGYERLQQAIDSLTEEELHFKPGLDKWSIHEIIVHLADAEMIGVHRMKRVLAETNPMLTLYDQDGWARSLSYSELDAGQYLQLFRLLRESMLPVLKRAEEADWQRIGIHEEAGPLTLSQLLQRYVNHVRDHLAQMERVRAAYGK